MGRTLFLIPLLLATTAFGVVKPSGNDPQVAAAQQLLARAQLYAGEITGELDRPTEAALRQFQMLRNLPVTGRMDDDTVAQLHLPPRDVILADREFLENSAPMPPPPAPVAAPPAAPNPTATPAPPGEIRQKSVQTFLNFYLKAASYKKARPELTYFAGSVDYFDHGWLTHEQLETELSRDRSQRFALVTVDEVTPLGGAPNKVAIRFTVRVTPLTRQGRKKPVSNVEKREATLERAPEGTLKLTSIKKTE